MRARKTGSHHKHILTFQGGASVGVYCKIVSFFLFVCSHGFPLVPFYFTGRLGWAMVLGSFQCRGVLLLLHIVGQGPAVLAARDGWAIFFFYMFHLSSLSNVLSFGRRLNMTEILWS